MKLVLGQHQHHLFGPESGRRRGEVRRGACWFSHKMHKILKNPFEVSKTFFSTVKCAWRVILNVFWNSSSSSSEEEKNERNWLYCLPMKGGLYASQSVTKNDSNLLCCCCCCLL